MMFVLIAGCSWMGTKKSLYEVRMMNGDTLYSPSKPNLDNDGYYRFYDVNDQQYILNKNLVLFIDQTTVEK